MNSKSFKLERDVLTIKTLFLNKLQTSVLR